MYIRGKIVKDALYFQVVEGYRDDAGRVRQRNIIALGQCEDIDEALDQVARDNARCKRRLKKLDEMWQSVETVPGWARRETERLRAALARQAVYKAKLLEVQKRLSG